MSFDIRLERLLSTSPEVAFHHWVDADARCRWYGGEDGWTVEATTDLRVGGRYRVAWGPTPDRLYREEGGFEVVEPPHRLEYTSRSTPPTPAEGAPLEVRVTVTFQERDGETLLTLLEADYPSRELRDRFQGFVPAGLDHYERTLPSQVDGPRASDGSEAAGSQVRPA
jgi:uncharacterized protein YndB with AHSA1/START domain